MLCLAKNLIFLSCRWVGFTPYLSTVSIAVYVADIVYNILAMLLLYCVKYSQYDGSVVSL